MLESLAQRIDQRIPWAVDFPIPVYHRYYYESRRAEGLTDLADFRDVQGEYARATVSFSYDEVRKLAPEEFLLLQRELQAATVLSFSRRGEPLPEEIAQHIAPGDKRNVLIHEREHLEAVPESLREHSSIDVIFEIDSKGGLHINGSAVYDASKLADREHALIASAPQSLSEGDITYARIYAGNTKDPGFIALIEERIGSRSQH